MVDKETLIGVTNRDNGVVGYTIPDMNNLHRSFQPGEKKEITFEELRKLYYMPGGDVIIRELLAMDNEEAISELLGSVEPEYHYTEAEVKTLLLSGSIDQFMDCLDFAPEGVIEIMKDLAVKLEISDLRKREALQQKTGLDISRAIQANHEAKESDENEPVGEKRRRATPVVNVTEAETPSRRTSPTSKYRVVSKEGN